MIIDCLRIYYTIYHKNRRIKNNRKLIDKFCVFVIEINTDSGLERNLFT